MTDLRRGLGLFPAAAISVLFVVIAAGSGMIPFRQVVVQERSIDLAVRQRNALAAENIRLEQRAAALQSPVEVERMAREQFGLVRPGEVAFIAAPVPDTAETALPTEPIFEERIPLWRRVWNFMTGHDLIDE